MEVARLYLAAQQSFVALVQELDDDGWHTPVPCTPGWTVHDVTSHVAGLADDAINDRMAGAPGEAWTAAQVERCRDMPREELLALWTDQASEVARLFEAAGIPQPPFDCQMHEHDVRHALGRPGNRDGEVMAALMEAVRVGWDGRPVTIELGDGSNWTTAGTGEPRRLAGVTLFDVTRAYFGRRSRAQVAGWGWKDPLSDAEFERFFRFGPSDVDIDE